MSEIHGRIGDTDAFMLSNYVLMIMKNVVYGFMIKKLLEKFMAKWLIFLFLGVILISRFFLIFLDRLIL